MISRWKRCKPLMLTLLPLLTCIGLPKSSSAFLNLKQECVVASPPVLGNVVGNGLSQHVHSNPQTRPRKSSHSQFISLRYGRNDNLFSGLAEIGIGFSLGVIWSEYFIIETGCGPPNFSDTLERICYQGVIVLSGVALFNRIVARQSLEKTVEDCFGPLLEATLLQVRVAEIVTVIAVLGAFVALGVQYQSNVDMDGLSGIDVSFCRTLRDS